MGKGLLALLAVPKKGAKHDEDEPESDEEEGEGSELEEAMGALLDAIKSKDTAAMADAFEAAHAACCEDELNGPDHYARSADNGGSQPDQYRRRYFRY